MLDRSKPFGVIRGSGDVAGYMDVRFMQDGNYFKGDGKPAKKRQVKSTAKPAAKACGQTGVSQGLC